jgi:hypothetical protein
MTDANAIADAYLAAWNEPDAERRVALARQVFAPGATYLDPMMRGEGPEGIAAMIGAAREKLPGLVFSRGSAEQHHDRIRYTWALGPAGGAPIARGTDFATLAGGRLAQVTGFIDQAPTGQAA